MLLLIVDFGICKASLIVFDGTTTTTTTTAAAAAVAAAAAAAAYICLYQVGLRLAPQSVGVCTVTW